MRNMIIFFVSFMLISCVSDEQYRIEMFSGIEFPENIEMITKVDNWTSPNGEGYSLRIYKLIDSASWIDENTCGLDGFTKSMLNQMNIRLPIIEKRLNSQLPVCYKVEMKEQEEVALFIQNKLIYFYWAGS